ncbi:MAG: serine/threonine-protein kinase [Actinomycetes bacterium]
MGGGFSAPGYDVDGLLGFGAFGEVWTARARTSGRRVALRRIRVPDGPVRRDRIRAGASLLTAVEHPHLVRVHGAFMAGDSVILVLDHVPGGSLTRLLECRGRLTASEVVTLLVPLAQALSVVHDHGLTHGQVSPSSVLLTDDGRPMLSDVGLLRLLTPPDAPAAGGEAGDVHDLAATCWTALVGLPPYDGAHARIDASGLDGAGERVAAALELGLQAGESPARGRRVSADALAAAVFAAAPAAPLRLHTWARPHPLVDPRNPDAGRDRPDGAGRHRSRSPGGRSAVPDRRLAARGWRAWAVALLGVAALTMAALSGLAWAGADADAPPAGVRVVQPSKPVVRHGRPVDWAAVLRHLDARRADAFAAADFRRLDGLYARGAPALARDRTRLRQLAGAGVRAKHLHLRATRVEVRTQQAARVVLRVVDVLDPYELRTTSGRLVERRPGRAAKTWAVTLVKEREVWRIYDVAAS